MTCHRKLSLRLVWPGIITDADRALRVRHPNSEQESHICYTYGIINKTI